MKYLLILFTVFLCSCHTQNTDGGVYESDYSNTYATTISNGDLIFYVKETYQYGSGSIMTTVLNNSPNYMYNFDFQLEIFQDGVIVDSSGSCSIYDLYPGQSQDGGYLTTRYTINDQFIRIVVSNVHKIRLNTPQ